MTKNIFLPTLHTILNDFRSFDEAFNGLYNNNEMKRGGCYNIEESDKNYSIEIDMPGVKREDLEIGIKENVLSISAKRKKTVKAEDGETKEEVISNYEQSFNISTKGIDVDNIEANLNSGVLTITLPKKEEIKYERKINIA